MSLKKVAPSILRTKKVLTLRTAGEERVKVVPLKILMKRVKANELFEIFIKENVLLTDRTNITNAIVSEAAI
ncbi:hypothetical protein NQ317_012352, partial [Molorchus minor]